MGPGGLDVARVFEGDGLEAEAGDFEVAGGVGAAGLGGVFGGDEDGGEGEGVAVFGDEGDFAFADFGNDEDA